MKKVLITGGAGTIGSAFISEYKEKYSFISINRNEFSQQSLLKRFPFIQTYMVDISNYCDYAKILDKTSPDIVIHAAAIKHVDLAEKQPIKTINTNILGSLNIIDANIKNGVPITVAISTDKACDHANIYGMSKYLMEKCFLEADSDKNRFCVCRFGNVAYSNGSVLPFWKKLASENKPLKVTHKDMNRMIFSQKEAANLIYKSILMAEAGEEGFILSKKMKSVNMLNLAHAISDKIEIVGIRPGEKLDEDLISQKEIPYSKVLDDGFIKITRFENMDMNSRLERPYNTKTADYMTNQDIQDLINSDI